MTDLSPDDLPAPYVGLRPFEFHEAALFYGRGEHIAEMVRTLRKSHFLAVVGSSGSGKSSLVRAGLLPAIAGGFMNGSEEAADWRFVIMRPGLDPYENLLHQLLPKLAPDQSLEPKLIKFRHQTLRGGPRGLMEAVNDSLLPESTRLVVLVDQFEEIFRFLERGDHSQPDDESSLADRRNDALAFVDMLLATAAERDPHLYLVLTMRSEYLGECEAFLGLSAAIAKSQFLTPRMTREQIQDIIERPIAAVGGLIEQMVVTNLLNALGTSQDQLPRVEHILLRMWNRAYDTRQIQMETDQPVSLTLDDYRKAGCFEFALNQHAEELYRELGPDAKIGCQSEKQRIAKEMFCSLADRSSQGTLIRRLSSLGEVASIAGVSEQSVAEVVEHFRQPGCNFLVATSSGPLTDKTTLDISHEALLRRWDQLDTWIKKEADSADMYRSLAAAAGRNGSLWRGQDLQLALEWRDQRQPTETWAKRYQNGFKKAMSFLQRSEEQRDYERAEDNFARKLRIARNSILFIVLALLFIDPLNFESRAVDDYYIMPHVIRALRSQHIVVLPREEIDHLAAADTLKIGSDGEKALSNAKGHNAKHIKYALEGYLKKIDRCLILKVDNPLPMNDSQSRAEPQNEVDEFLKKAYSRVELAVREANEEAKHNKSLFPIKMPEQIFVVVEQDIIKNPEKQSPSSAVTRATHERRWQSWERAGVAVFPKQEFPEKADFETLYASPQLIDVALPLDKQTVPIAFALDRNEAVRKILLEKPERIKPTVRGLQILVHLLGYFALVFIFGIIYRQYAFRYLGMTADSISKHNKWEIFGHSFSGCIDEFSAHFQQRRWKAILSFVFLLATLASINFKLSLGLILILLAPADALWKRSLVCRLKAVQGFLLQAGGYYALAASAVLLVFLSADDNTGRSVFLPGWNPWMLGIMGIALIILGKRKRLLAAEETLVRESDRAPVLYLRSVEAGGQSRTTVSSTWLSLFFKSNDEEILWPIFGELGQFVDLSRAEELLLHLGSVDDDSVSQRDGQTDATGLMGRSALVIMQIDDRVTEYFYSKLKQALQILRPDQMMLYFSQELGTERLNTAYHNFVKDTRDIFPYPLSQEIDANHVIFFNEDWRPIVCGTVSTPKISWRNILPLLGRRLDIAHMRRSFTRTLEPFFKSRKMLPSKTKLFGDHAIGLAAFPLFGLGMPSGVMMFGNFWQMGRRWAAWIGLVAPSLGIVGMLGLLALVSYVSDSAAYSMDELDIYAYLILTTYVLTTYGYSFATFWLWRRLSGRDIRRHIAFGGARQPMWKTFLVLIVFGIVGIFTIFMLATMTLDSADSLSTVNCSDDPGHPNVTKDVLGPSGRIVSVGNKTTFLRFSPSSPGQYRFDLKAERAGYQKSPVDPRIAIYSLDGGVCELLRENDDTEFSLDSQLILHLEATNYLIGVQSLSAEGKAVLLVNQGAPAVMAPAKVKEGQELARQGKVDEAKEALQEALRLDPNIDLDPKSDVRNEDARSVAQRLAAGEQVSEGNRLAQEGKTDDAIAAYQQALELNPSLDSDAVYWNELGWLSSLGGRLKYGLDASEKAVRLSQAGNDKVVVIHSLDTRGLARALTGDTPGAIEDLDAVLDSDVSDGFGTEYKAQRREWVHALRNGKQPFTPQLLKELRSK